ncbi:hypothetical protein AYI68_g7077 [Smittium mucronatum]|uniref:Uncharacterized protein n=1 Tax=Smittium mucronatum TaxID=133383 RepID=A0A1R0GPT4_9FUNG|nr:hypothetical protein AYI68_g7077 [Smittium mucronatum]
MYHENMTRIFQNGYDANPNNVSRGYSFDSSCSVKISHLDGVGRVINHSYGALISPNKVLGYFDKSALLSLQKYLVSGKFSLSVQDGSNYQQNNFPVAHVSRVKEPQLKDLDGVSQEYIYKHRLKTKGLFIFQSNTNMTDVPGTHYCNIYSKNSLDLAVFKVLSSSQTFAGNNNNNRHHPNSRFIELEPLNINGTLTSSILTTSQIEFGQNVPADSLHFFKDDLLYVSSTPNLSLFDTDKITKVEILGFGYPIHTQKNGSYRKLKYVLTNFIPDTSITENVF